MLSYENRLRKCNGCQYFIDERCCRALVDCHINGGSTAFANELYMTYHDQMVLITMCQKDGYKTEPYYGRVLDVVGSFGDIYFILENRDDNAQLRKSCITMSINVRDIQSIILAHEDIN